MVTISLCMIVRNEEPVLARCLESFKNTVDEIIIVDTGSADKTKAIAKGYTSLIYDFSWINDFAAARNESFAKASMDYCMWADADDILPESEAAKLIDWKSNTDLITAPDVVMMKYATAFNEDGSPSFQYYRERLIRNGRGFRWKGRVHEAITPSGNIAYLDIFIEHHSIKTSYSTRNLDIYEEMLRSSADGNVFEARDLFYYARELYYHGHYAKAIENFARLLLMPEAFVENKVEACRIAAYCSYPLGKPEQALSFLYRGLSYRVPGGELCCDIARHYMDRKAYEHAVFWYLAALNAPKKTENGGFISEECYGYLPALQLSVCYYKLGNFDTALKYHRLAGHYNPSGEHYLKNDVFFQI